MVLSRKYFLGLISVLVPLGLLAKDIEVKNSVQFENKGTEQLNNLAGAVESAFQSKDLGALVSKLKSMDKLKRVKNYPGFNLIVYNSLRSSFKSAHSRLVDALDKLSSAIDIKKQKSTDLEQFKTFWTGKDFFNQFTKDKDKLSSDNVKDFFTPIEKAVNKFSAVAESGGGKQREEGDEELKAVTLREQLAELQKELAEVKKERAVGKKKKDAKEKKERALQAEIAKLEEKFSATETKDESKIAEVVSVDTAKLVEAAKKEIEEIKDKVEDNKEKVTPQQSKDAVVAAAAVQTDVAAQVGATQVTETVLNVVADSTTKTTEELKKKLDTTNLDDLASIAEVAKIILESANANLDVLSKICETQKSLDLLSESAKKKLTAVLQHATNQADLFIPSVADEKIAKGINENKVEIKALFESIEKRVETETKQGEKGFEFAILTTRDSLLKVVNLYAETTTQIGNAIKKCIDENLNAVSSKDVGTKKIQSSDIDKKLKKCTDLPNPIGKGEVTASIPEWNNKKNVFVDFSKACDAYIKEVNEVFKNYSEQAKDAITKYSKAVEEIYKIVKFAVDLDVIQKIFTIEKTGWVFKKDTPKFTDDYEGLSDALKISIRSLAEACMKQRAINRVLGYLKKIDPKTDTFNNIVNAVKTACIDDIKYDESKRTFSYLKVKIGFDEKDFVIIDESNENKAALKVINDGLIGKGTEISVAHVLNIVDSLKSKLKPVKDITAAFPNGGESKVDASKLTLVGNLGVQYDSFQNVYWESNKEKEGKESTFPISYEAYYASRIGIYALGEISQYSISSKGGSNIALVARCDIQEDICNKDQSPTIDYLEQLQKFDSDKNLVENMTKLAKLSMMYAYLAAADKIIKVSAYNYEYGRVYKVSPGWIKQREVPIIPKQYKDAWDQARIIFEEGRADIVNDVNELSPKGITQVMTYKFFDAPYAIGTNKKGTDKKGTEYAERAVQVDSGKLDAVLEKAKKLYKDLANDKKFKDENGKDLTLSEYVYQIEKNANESLAKQVAPKGKPTEVVAKINEPSAEGSKQELGKAIEVGRPEQITTSTDFTKLVDSVLGKIEWANKTVDCYPIGNVRLDAKNEPKEIGKEEQSKMAKTLAGYHGVAFEKFDYLDEEPITDYTFGIGDNWLNIDYSYHGIDLCKKIAKMYTVEYTDNNKKTSIPLVAVDGELVDFTNQAPTFKLKNADDEVLKESLNKISEDTELEKKLNNLAGIAKAYAWLAVAYKTIVAAEEKLKKQGWFSTTIPSYLKEAEVQANEILVNAVDNIIKKFPLFGKRTESKWFSSSKLPSPKFDKKYIEAAMRLDEKAGGDNSVSGIAYEAYKKVVEGKFGPEGNKKTFQEWVNSKAAEELGKTGETKKPETPTPTAGTKYDEAMTATNAIKTDTKENFVQSFTTALKAVAAIDKMTNEQATTLAEKLEEPVKAAINAGRYMAPSASDFNGDTFSNIIVTKFANAGITKLSRVAINLSSVEFGD